MSVLNAVGSLASPLLLLVVGFLVLRSLRVVSLVGLANSIDTKEKIRSLPLSTTRLECVRCRRFACKARRLLSSSARALSARTTSGDGGRSANQATLQA